MRRWNFARNDETITFRTKFLSLLVLRANHPRQQAWTSAFCAKQKRDRIISRAVKWAGRALFPSQKEMAAMTAGLKGS